MTTYPVEPTDKALADARNAYAWIAEQSDQAALRGYQGLLNAFRSLETKPLRCPLAPESAFFYEDVRQLLYGRYRILFAVENEKVFILRVRHGSRKYSAAAYPKLSKLVFYYLLRQAMSRSNVARRNGQQAIQECVTYHFTL